MGDEDETVLPGMSRWVCWLLETSGATASSLLSDPARGSACKRHHLFLRWMVRQDDIDPGGWTLVLPRKLIVPVDVHMHRVGVRLGFTQRKQADAKTALEITDGFRRMSPDDPVKYDFALTRPGILGDDVVTCLPSETLAKGGTSEHTKRPS